ncbi:major capsid protein P2 [Photobacterium damselae]|uniref:major capsid protein P2 n=1 Tax=Photobacterium damselae TaxID=38293 RepID=UPI0010FDE99A|nr:major capsid protein P2 [Photobacterium damselae]KAB1510144.1 hypothetical protein FD717_011600 [Photobacterium damselae subsp. damselae]TLS70785.1 hypothetical protein FD718_05510 [Photobacterium damselae subsp. damselae]
MQNCRHRKLSAFSGVVAGGKATLVLPVGDTYEQIILRTNLNPDELKRVEITLNDDKIYNLTSTHLRALRQYHEKEDPEGFYVIPFSDFDMKARQSTASTALVTELTDHITLDVTLSDSIPTSKGILIDTFAVVSDPQPFRQLLPRMYTQTMTATANGDNDFSGIISSPTRFIRRAHFHTGKMDKLEIHRDSRIEGEYHLDVVNMIAKDNNKTPLTDVFTYDPLVYGFMLGFVLPTAHQSEFFFRCHTTEVVQSIEILMEVIEQVA